MTYGDSSSMKAARSPARRAGALGDQSIPPLGGNCKSPGLPPQEQYLQTWEVAAEFQEMPVI
jgi:hypothetical protein